MALSWTTLKAKLLRRRWGPAADPSPRTSCASTLTSANVSSNSQPILPRLRFPSSPFHHPLGSELDASSSSTERSRTSARSLHTAPCYSVADDSSAPATPSPVVRYYGSTDDVPSAKSHPNDQENRGRPRKLAHSQTEPRQRQKQPLLSRKAVPHPFRSISDRQSVSPERRTPHELPPTVAITPPPPSGSDRSRSTSPNATQYFDPEPSRRETVDYAPQPQSQPVQTPPVSLKRPGLGARRQSILTLSYQQDIKNLLTPSSPFETASQCTDPVATEGKGIMGPRKIWVKRPGGSATLVPISGDSVVDELRDQVILKYGNSLGRTFDAPDIVIRITPREGSNRQPVPDRILSPEESLVSLLDSYYPGGQKVDEALVIDIPPRRSPKPSPRPNVYYQHEPGDHGEYFPIMPANPNVPTPPAHPPNTSGGANAHPTPSMAILSGGVAPALHSPGSRGHRSRRPPIARHSTNSPTMLGSASTSKETGATPGAVPAQPTPPVPAPPAPPESPQNKAMTPPARGTSPRPRTANTKGKKGSTQAPVSGLFGGLVEGTVPPINVLIVEDNVINQRLLEAFMKRLSVRWKCAANGEEAVKKWRQGGFHLVLMDIQLPVMNGLDATKEIRRLERLNGIGVFPKLASGRSSAATANATSPVERSGGSYVSLKEEDNLHDPNLFKSPVIIVALTASSLQSDRHEALAAGCNDFLTKPVRFEWLEQKVTEWGCMQALIDFEGWRKWRGFADDNQSQTSAETRASPMQPGNDAKLPTSPYREGPVTKSLNGVQGSRPASQTKMRSVQREDSGSGSGGDNDSQDSPQIPAPVGVSSPGDADVE